MINNATYRREVESEDEIDYFDADSYDEAYGEYLDGVLEYHYHSEDSQNVCYCDDY